MKNIFRTRSTAPHENSGATTARRWPTSWRSWPRRRWKSWASISLRPTRSPSLTRHWTTRVWRTLSSCWPRISGKWSVVFFKKWANHGLFLLFSSFSLCINIYNNINWRKHTWFAWDSNPRLQNGRCRGIYWAMGANFKFCVGSSVRRNKYRFTIFWEI